jgi:glutaredoxin
MKKSAKLSILVIALLFIAGLVAVLIKNQPNQILFYSDTCPHCKIVEQYITDNKVKNYLAFQQLEVSTHPDNAQLLIKKAASCGLSTDNLGVPFFFDGTNCLIGDQDIIKYFASKK